MNLWYYLKLVLVTTTAAFLLFGAILNIHVILNKHGVFYFILLFYFYEKWSLNFDWDCIEPVRQFDSMTIFYYFTISKHKHLKTSVVFTYFSDFISLGMVSFSFYLSFTSCLSLFQESLLFWRYCGQKYFNNF